MVNTERIVQVTTTDLLTLYSVILMQNGDNSSMALAESSDVEGNFTISTTGVKLANQPVKKVNFTGASGTLYFVASFDYDGFYINGTFEEPQAGSAEVAKDRCSLYKAVLSSGDITITKVGL